MLGLVFGGAAGIVAEANDSSLHRARDLQFAVNVPVLASIPTIIFESDRAQLMQKRFRQTVAVAGVVIFCLAGGAATYVFVNGAPGWVAAVLGGDDEERGDETVTRVRLPRERV